MITGTPRRSAPPLLFVLFWNGFTALHAYFMLGGVWGTGAMLFLVPFYLLFFAVGLWMARSWLGALGLRLRYGSPTLQPLAPAVPGQPLHVGVEFDRAWSAQERLGGQLCWVEVLSRGGSGRLLAESALTGAGNPGARGTLWQGMAVVPARPPGAQAMRLEILLQPFGGAPGSGWRFEVPAQSPAFADAIELTPEQSAQADTVLGWTVAGLNVLGVLLLWPVFAHGGRTLFPLVFPGGAFLAAWIVSDLRATVRSATGAGSATREQMLERMRPFLRSAKARGRWFVLLALAAFFADMFGVLERL